MVEIRYFGFLDNVEYVSEPNQRIDITGFTSGEERVHHSDALPSDM